MNEKIDYKRFIEKCEENGGVLEEYNHDIGCIFDNEDKFVDFCDWLNKYEIDTGLHHSFIAVNSLVKHELGIPNYEEETEFRVNERKRELRILRYYSEFYPEYETSEIWSKVKKREREFEKNFPKIVENIQIDTFPSHNYEEQLVRTYTKENIMKGESFKNIYKNIKDKTDKYANDIFNEFWEKMEED